GVVGVLVIVGSLLAVSEASLTRITRVRVMSLKEEGRRNAGLLEKIEADLPRYLNSVYFSVMLVQNGSAILVAILAERLFAGEGEGWWVALVSAVFTLAYFVFVEAMSKTFGVVHSDRAALLVAPIVYGLGRALALPTRALIGLANVLIPGQGLKQGPFVEEEIRSMAAVGHEEGTLEQREAQLIHSVFDFGDRLVREVMVPRPDMVAAPVDGGMQRVLDLMLQHGHSRIPVYNSGIDDIAGVVYAKDLLRHLHAGKGDVRLAAILRDPIFVPETNKAAQLLQDMQFRRVHIAIVTDEYGSTAGMVTIEDLLEELVGEIADEYDTAEQALEKISDDKYLVSGRLSVSDVSQLLGVDLPHGQWDTIAGLVYGLVGAVPTQGTVVSADGVLLTVEQLQGRRIAKVLVERSPDASRDAVAE
ncbi:MAG TPA: hemolysin family protein, partial [Actinomycetota bacterium]|nr:hemolysin family protein [Actinomycetota bacterium]